MYSWDGGAFAADSTFMASVGTHYVVATNAAGCNTEPVTFTVASIANDLQITASAMVVCEGEHVVLNADLQGTVDSNVVYTWTPGGNGPTIDVVPAAGENKYVVEATYGSCSNSDTIVIVANALPAAPTSIVADPTEVCVGAQTNVKATATGAAYYTWYVDGIEVPGMNLDSIAVNLNEVGTHNITARIVDTNGCVSPLAATVATVDVKTAPTGLAVYGETVVCNRDSSLFIAHADSATMYSWDGGAFAADSTFKASVGTHYVVATNNAGCNTEPVTFNVVSIGNDLHILASATSVCDSMEHVTLTADLSDIVDSNVVYTWSTGSHYSTIDVIPSTSTHVYAVTASYGACSHVDSIEIFINPIPTITNLTSDKSVAICPDEQVIFTATSTDAVSYIWYVDGVEVPGQNRDTLLPTDHSVGIHYVTVKGVSAAGCISEPFATKTYEIEAAPSLVAINGDNMICYGDSAMIFVTHVGGSSYVWSNGATTDTIFVVPGVYTVTVSSDHGCQTIADPFTVREFGPDIQLTASETQVCAGAAVTLNANADGWTGNITYTWEDGTITSTTTVHPDSSTWYKVTSTVTSNSGYGTADHICSRVDSILIEVLPIPEVDTIIIASNLDTLCYGSQLSLTAIPDTFAAYRWFADGFEIPGENLSTITFVPQPGVHIYAVKAISASGCEDQDSVVLSVPIMVLPNPSIVITGDPLICHDSLIRLYANINDTTFSTAGNALYNYEWRVYNYTIDTSSSAQTITNPYTGETFTINPLGADSAVFESYFPHQDHPYIFTVNATNANGCVASSEPYYVYVADTIFVAVTLDYDSVCPGGEVTAIAHLGNYYTPGLSFQWFKNDSLIPWATEPWFTSTVDADPTEFKVVVSQTSTGCVGIGADTAHFIIPPTVKAVVAINGMNSDSIIDVCEGAQISVVAYLDSAQTIVDTSLLYVWKENGFWMPLVTGPYFSKQMWILDHDTANYVYEVFAVTNIPGCAPVPVSSNKIHVRRNPIVMIEGVHNVCYRENSTTPNVILAAYADGRPQYDTTCVHNWYRNGALVNSTLLMNNLLIELVEPTYLDPVVYMVEIVNGDGCSAFSEPFPVEVYAAPVVNILPSDTLICTGGVVTLEASINNYNDPMLTYQWYKNSLSNENLLGGRTHATETFTLTETTTFIVDVTHLMNDPVSGSICDGYDTITIVVNPDPVLTVTNDLPASKTLCDGRSVTFNATITPGVDTVGIFTWYRNGEIIPGAVGAQFTETPHAISDYPTTYIYEVSVVQPTTGCESVVTLADTVIVNPNPTLAIETDPIVCRADSDNVVMYAHVYPEPTTPYTFTWFEDNVALDTNFATGAHKDTITLTREYRDYPYNFSIALVNEYGCQATAEALIYVDTLPVVNITATETEICVGGEITLTAHLNNWNTPNMQYQWYDNGVLIPGATNLDYTVVPDSGSHKYTFNAKQLNSLCEATSDSLEVNVYGDPILNVTDDLPASHVLCDGRSVTFTAHVTGGVTGGEIFTWYRNGEVIPNAVDSVFTETPHAISDYPTNYVYEVSVKQTAAGCESMVTFADTLTVTPNPTLQIETDPIVCGDDSNNVVLIANIDPAPTTDYYFAWYEDNVAFDTTLATGAHKDTLTLSKPYRDYPYNFNVVLVNDYGCQATAETSVYVDSVPVITIFATETEICVGGEITLTANLNNWNTPNMQFQWYDNDTLIAGATSLTYTVVPAQGSHDYTFVAKQLNSLCQATSNTVNVTVNADPKVSVTTDLPASHTLCDGRSVTFTAHVTGGVTGGEIFTWYRNGEVIPNAVDSVFTETPHAISDYPTHYVYEVSVKQTAAGCESMVTFADTLTVNPNPTLAIETDPFVCGEGNNNIVMIANVNPAPTTDYHFIWLEDNAVIPAADATVTGAHLDTIALTKPYRDYPYNFSVILINDYGCQATAETQIYVDTTPVVNITVTENEICVGGEITLTANLNNWNTPNMQYQWYDNDTLIAGATSLTYTVVPAQGVHDYKFNAKQLNSLCEATSTALTVTVNADPKLTVTNDLPASHVLCDGRSVTFYAHVAGGVTGGEVFTWYRNGEVIPDAVDSVFTETPHAVSDYPTHYVYEVSVKQSAAGCESMVTFADTLTVNPNPTLAIETDPIVCQETAGNITMVAHVYPEPTTNYTFTWFEDNAPLTGATGIHADTIVLTRNYRDYPYNFSISLVNDYGCQATAETQVYVDTVPVINIQVTENTICIGGEITLTANLNNWNTPNMQYQWYDNNNLIAGATSLTYTVAPALGTHRYTFTAEQLNSHCIATSNELTVNVIADPVIANVSMSDTIVCQGAQIAITANAANYTPSTDDVYTWYRNGILMPGATAQTIYDSPVTVDNNTQQYIYTAVVTRTPSGCTSLPVASAALTVYPNPTVVITGDQHICETQSVYLIANTDTIGMNVGTLHYTWYESGMIRDNMAYNYGDNQFYGEYWYARTEPYRFVVEVQREGVPAACAARSQEFLVYVYPQPIVNITATETEICETGEVTLTANLVDPNQPNMVYQWYEIRNRVDSFATSYDANGNLVYTTYPVAYRYYIPGANSNTYTTNYYQTTTMGVTVFQTHSTCTDFDEIVITVNPRPVVTNVTVNNVAIDTVCDGAQVNLAATITPADAQGAVYTWFRNGIEIPGANQSTFSENVYTTDNHVTTNVYTVMVTLPMAGCISDISTMNATVVVNPAPSTVSISGNNIICENDSTTLTAYSDVQGEFTWSTGSHDTSITVPAGVYTVTMRTVEGCEMTSAPFTVEALGTDLLVSASETHICAGEHTTLYVNQDGWAGNVTYQWDANADSSIATTVDVHPEVTTTYHVTATVNSTNGTCQAVGEVTIVVTPLPATLTVTGDTTICEGQQATLTAHTTDSDITGYIWYQNGVEIAGENQAVITINFPAYGTYNFAAKAINNQGCVSAEASLPATVIVTPAPTVVSISGDNVICEGDSTVLTVYTDVPGTILWSNGETGNTVTVPAGVYTATVTTAQGCEMTSDPFTVEALGSDLIVSASETHICAGEHTTLYVDQAGWAGNVSYQWDAQAGNSTSPTVDVAPAVTTTYHVTATVNSTNGTNGSCSVVREITIVVTPLPVTLVVTGDTTICEGQQATLTASTTDNNITGYIWYQNGVEIAGENQAIITVNFPAYGSYEFSAKAINDQGCVSALASNPATVVVTPAPTVVSITGNNIICENDVTTLTVYSDVQGSILWSTGATTPSINVPAGVYTVTVTTPQGCSMTSDPFTVEALGTDLLVSASETHICAGEHVTLYVNQDGWAGNVTYAWDSNAGNSTATTVDVAPATTTTYHVTATVHSTNNTNGCTAIGQVTIDVTPLPAALVVTGDTTICEGQQATMTATTTDNNISGYIWYQNGVEIPGENQASITVNFPAYGNYVYTAKAVNDQGCVSAIASNPVNVVVTPAPTVVSISGNNIICENDVTTLTVYTDIQNPIITWSTGSHAASINVPAGVYTVTVRNAQGCEMTSEPFTVEALGTDLLVSASETHICAGEHTTLYVNQDGWAGNVTYQWDANAGNSTATTVDVTPSVTTTYHVTATVNSTNNATGCTAIGEVTIVVTPLPGTLTVNASVDSICEGEQVTLTATPLDPTATYIWYQNGIEIIGENQNIITLNFPTEGTYTFAAKAMNSQGCVSAQASLPVTVVVNAAPDAVVISGNLEICNGGTTTLYADVTPNNMPGATYQWYKNGLLLAGATNPYLTVATAGAYKVDVTTNGCTTTADAVNVVVNQAPQLQLTATETTICNFGTTTIAAEATGWNNADVNYTWSNGFHGSSFNFTPTVAGDYTFTVTVSQSTNGSQSIGCDAVDSITIHVNAGPGAPVLTVNNPVICEGAQVILTMTDTNSINYGTPTITWFNNGAVMAGNQTVVTLTPALGINNYNVVVEYPNSGCNTAISDIISVVVNEIPTVAVELTTGNNNILCDGGTTTLTANVTPAGTYNYQWMLNNVILPNETNASLTVTLAARESAYEYQVIVSGNPGCTVTSAVTPITVVADPVVVATVDNAVICEGGHATFTVSVDGGVAGLNGYTFAWFNNNDNTTPIANTPTLTVNNPTAGVYAYRVLVTSPYGCSTFSAPVNLTVVNDPTVTVAVAAGYDATICENGSTMLVANVTGGYGTTSYQWYSNGLPILGETNQTLVLNNVANNNFVYTVKVTQSGVDCEAWSTNTINPFTVVAPYAVTVTGNANTCVGGTVTLTATVTGVLAGDVPTYQWYRVSANGVATPVAGANTAVYTTEPLLNEGSYEYYVEVSSNISGCTTISDSYTANVVADPTVVINGAHAVCVQGQLRLNATVNGGIPGVQYQYIWNWTGAGTGSATTAVNYYEPNLPANDGANHYYFTVTIVPVGTSGCDATSAAHEVDVYAVPAVTVTADHSYLCNGGDVTFTANVTPAGNYNYAWVINGVANATNAASVTTTVTNAGPVSATVTVSANNNLVSCATTATIAVPVQVVADPVVTIAANHTAMCAGGTTTLNVANIVANNNVPTNYTYQWAVNGHEIPGAINNTFSQTLNDAGTYVYTLKLTQNDNLGCVSDWSAPVTVLVAEQPTVTLYNSDGNNICEGGSIDLNAVVDNYGNTIDGVLNSSVYGPMTYTWTMSGNAVQVNPNVTAGTNQLSQTLNTVGNYSYAVLVAPSGYACQPVSSNTVVVSVANDPTWTDVHVYYPDMCAGDQVNLIATIVGGVADYNNNTGGYIQWTVTYNGTTSNVTGGQGGTTYDIPTQAGNYIYTPTYVGNMGSGCQLTNTAAVAQPVIVHEIPTAAFISGDGATICGNDPDASVELVIAFTGGAPYTFDIENMMTGDILPYHVSLTDTFSFYVTPDMTTRYRIIALSNAFCQNDEIATLATSEATVNVNVVEFVETVFRPVNCGDPVVVSFNIISGDQNAPYALYENGTMIASGNVVANQVVIPDGLLSEGTHNLTLVIGGCNYDITVVIPVNSENSNIFGDNLMEVRWDDVVIINLNANPRYEFVGFQWYKNNELIPGAIYKNYQEIGGLNGFYSVVLTVLDTETGEMLTFETCPRPFNTVSNMKVYPVPANVEQVVTIELDLTSEELNGAVLDIFDATGKLINHMTDLQPVTRVAGFKAQGTYFGRIITGTNEIKTVKFVIVK